MIAPLTRDTSAGGSKMASAAAPENFLTDAERETLNAADAIIQRHTPEGACWMLTTSSHAGMASTSLTYFTSRKAQNGYVRGATFADKIAEAMRLQHAEDADLSGARQRQIEKLRGELDRLTQEQAA